MLQTEFVDDEGVMVRSMLDWATLILKRLRSSNDPDFLQFSGAAIDQIERDVVVLAEQILWQERDTPVVFWRMQRLLVNLTFVKMRLGGLPVEPPVMSGMDRIKPALATKERNRQAFEGAVRAAMGRDGGGDISATKLADQIIDDVKTLLAASPDSKTRAYPITARGVRDAIYDIRKTKDCTQAVL